MHHASSSSEAGRLVPRGAVLNVGIPMLALAWPILWVALAPVVVIEALMARQSLGLDVKAAFALSIRVNVISTLVGIPLTWAALLGIEMLVGISFNSLNLKGTHWDVVYFVFSAPWMAPTEDATLVYLAFLILIIPFCIMSILVEARIARRRLPDHDPARVFAWARFSNLVTYLLIVIGSGAFFWYMERSGV